MAFINTFFSQNIIAWEWDFLFAVLLAIFIACTLNWSRKFYLNRLGAHLSLLWSGNFLSHLLKLPLSFYQQRYAGEIVYRQTLNSSIADTFSNTLLSTGTDLVLIVFYACLLFVYDASIACVSVAAALCNFGVLYFVYRSRENAYARLQQNTARTIRQGISGLQQMETIKANSSESDFFSKWAGYYTHQANDRQEIGKKDVLLITMSPFFQLLATAVLLGVGSLRVIDGSLSIGMLMAMQILQINFLQPISRFVGFNQLIQNMKVDLARINDVMKNPVDKAYTIPKQLVDVPIRLKGRLEFKNVTFGYSLLAPPLIENLSFVIDIGERLALVGPTGSGKSTVAKLAARLLYPWSGQILFDGIPIEEIPKEQLYNSLATVDQEIFLFSGTIRENITLWNSALPDDIVIAAAKDAQIHEEIVMRPGNYDALLIEGGRNISGGQRQRLEIARALLYNPPFLILDEAMSSLDSKMEKEIAERIVLRGCSTLMIAHRLSTIQDCHEILVLHGGKLVQRGTHQELKATPGLYQELINNEQDTCDL
jgi:ATP-binding cassette subfamily C protein